MVVAIIQARMGSTRLPGKVLKTIAGKTILNIQIDRIANARIQKLVVAIPNGKENNILEDHLKSISINVGRGSEEEARLVQLVAVCLPSVPSTRGRCLCRADECANWPW